MYKQYEINLFRYKLVQKKSKLLFLLFPYIQDDVLLMKDMKLNHYRFSISWPRILPTGVKGKTDKEKSNLPKLFATKLREILSNYRQVVLFNS